MSEFFFSGHNQQPPRQARGVSPIVAIVEDGHIPYSEEDAGISFQLLGTRHLPRGKEV